MERRKETHSKWRKKYIFIDQNVSKGFLFGLHVSQCQSAGFGTTARQGMKCSGTRWYVESTHWHWRVRLSSLKDERPLSISRDFSENLSLPTLWHFPSPSLYPGDSFIMPCQHTSLKRPRQQDSHNMWGQEREEERDKVQWREVEMWRAWCYMWVVYITVRWDQVWTHMALQQSRAKLGDADVGIIKL